MLLTPGIPDKQKYSLFLFLSSLVFFLISFHFAQEILQKNGKVTLKDLNWNERCSRHQGAGMLLEDDLRTKFEQQLAFDSVLLRELARVSCLLFFLFGARPNQCTIFDLISFSFLFSFSFFVFFFFTFLFFSVP